MPSSRLKQWIFTLLAACLMTPLTLAQEDQNLLQQTLNVLYEGQQHLVDFEQHDQEYIVLLGFGEGKSPILRSLVKDGSNVSWTPTYLPASFYPELWVHRMTGSKIVDLTGYHDTGTTDSRILEIAANFFTQLVLYSAARLKLVFSVPYEAFQEAHGVLTYLHHISTFVNDQSKFSNSIAIVFTTNTTLPVNIESEIKMKLIDLKRRIEVPSSNKNFEMWTKIITLIDQLIHNNTSKFVAFNDNDNTTHGYLFDLVFRELEFTNITDKSQRLFRFTLSDSATAFNDNILVPYANGTDLNIMKYVLQIENQFRNYYENLGIQGSDISQYSNKIIKDYEKIEQFSLNGDFINNNTSKIQSFCSELTKDISLTCDSNNTISSTQYYKIIGFLLHKEYNEITSNWMRPLINLKEYLENIKQWYEFLNILVRELSKHDHQTSDSISLKNLLNSRVTSDTFPQFLEAISKDIPVNLHRIQQVSVNYFMLRDLNKILAYHSQVNTKATCVNGVFQVRGNFISLKEVSKRLLAASSCNNSLANSVDIYARSSVFVDTDLRLPSTHLTIFAPKWEIMGERLLNLDGHNGVARNKKASNGNTSLKVKGTDGLPGNPGQNAGSFLAAALILENSEYLNISANGGHGSAGQDGGDGQDIHFDTTIRFKHTKHFRELDNDLRHQRLRFSKTKNKRESKLIITIVSNNNHEVFDYGFNRHNLFNPAAKPGNGGLAGKEGSAGTIKFKTQNRHFLRAITNVRETRGKGGNGGKAGNAGIKDIEIYYKCIKDFKTQFIGNVQWKEDFISCRKRGTQIKSMHPKINAGRNNFNAVGSAQPRQLVAFHPNLKFEEFKQFVRNEELPTMNTGSLNQFILLLQ